MYRRQTDGLVPIPGHPLEPVPRHVLDAASGRLEKPVIWKEISNKLLFIFVVVVIFISSIVVWLMIFFLLTSLRITFLIEIEIDVFAFCGCELLLIILDGSAVQRRGGCKKTRLTNTLPVKNKMFPNGMLKLKR